MPIRYHQLRCALTITVLILSNVISSAQHRASLKAHTFSAINGLYAISYEQAFSKHLSAELSLQGGHYIDVQPNRWDHYEVTGIGAIGAFRYYPFTKKVTAPAGFFGYTAFRYVDFTEAFQSSASSDHYAIGGNILNVGLGIGYKFVYHRLGLEAFVGWGSGRLKSDDKEYRDNIPKFHRESIREQEHFPQLDLAICYLFSPFFKD